MSKTAVAADPYLNYLTDVKKHKGEILNNDNVFFSIFLIDEFETNWHKIYEWLMNKGIKIKFSETVEDSSVVIIDSTIFLKLSEASKGSDKKSFDPMTYKYWEEFTLALNKGKKVIDFNDVCVNFHDSLAKVDEQMYFNLANMLKSSEDETLNLAVSIMTSTNRSDEQTIKHLKTLTKNANDTKLRSNIDYRELIAFLAKIND